MAKMPDLKDYNPDEPFEGLGFLGWCKVIFRTRAQSLKQSDAVTHKLFVEMQGQHVALQKLAKLVLLQGAGLVAAQRFIEYSRDAEQNTHLVAYRDDTLALINKAVAAQGETI